MHTCVQFQNMFLHKCAQYQYTFIKKTPEHNITIKTSHDRKLCREKLLEQIVNSNLTTELELELDL